MRERWQNASDTEGIVQQIKTAWAGLDRRKQTLLVLASTIIIAMLFFMSRLASAPSMQLLYAGLEGSAAGDVINVLDQRGTIYEVRGRSIYVPAKQRDELRLALAGEGLPATGGKGYELLDALNGFGTTSQMFDAAYWRAKEGELARTIVASPHVAQARVHIANNGSNPFQRRVEPTASVSVVPSGAPVTAEQANAIRFLVASAVAGLAVENVAVIDASGTLIGPSDLAASPSTADDRAQLLRERVLRLVEARVGAGNAVVEVSVDTVTQSESIREHRFDPEGRVAISTESEERTDSSSGGASGDVTVASNLPDGDEAEGNQSQAQASETRERVNYEVSATEHEIIRAPGAIKRLTVAVLVNGTNQIGEDGNQEFQQRPEDELLALRDLVASAVGFDAERGDVITLKSMDLPTVEPVGTAAAAGFFQRFNLDVMSLIQMGVLAVVTLVLGLFVVRPILSKAQVTSNQSVAALPGVGHDPASDTPGPALTGEIDIGQPGEFGAVAQLDQFQNPADNNLPAISEGDQSPVERLRSMIGERQEESVEILRSWLEENQENA